MSALRLAACCLRPSMAFSRPMSMTVQRMASPGNAKEHEARPEHRKYQTEKPLNPYITRTNSAIAKETPKEGNGNPPPELISSVDPESSPHADLGVGEMEGGKFKIEPLRRTAEDENTMRARLVYQSRKRGTLESDLLMSTFADTHLQDMSMDQMIQYDLFLDENDWDIYYWATQEPMPTSRETAKDASSGSEVDAFNVQRKNMSSQVNGLSPGKQVGSELDTDAGRQGRAQNGEWAQTIGAFKPAYRPVPTRWKNSEILAMLRRHVLERSAGGVHGMEAEIGGEALSQGGGGMAFMPEVRNMDR